GTEVTTADPSDVDAEAFQRFVSREVFRKLKRDGYSHEAILEFFKFGLDKYPSGKEIEARYVLWLEKWKHSAKETTLAGRQEVLDEATQIFRNAYHATTLLQMLSSSGQLTKDNVHQLKPIFQSLPQYERGLIDNVMAHSAKKLYRKLGFDLGSDNE
ncbi:hypothetical protein PMAYCL1PPCAC_00041, partial [Pristionchus mayeri]